MKHTCSFEDSRVCLQIGVVLMRIVRLSNLEFYGSAVFGLWALQARYDTNHGHDGSNACRACDWNSSRSLLSLPARRMEVGERDKVDKEAFCAKASSGACELV